MDRSMFSQNKFMVLIASPKTACFPLESLKLDFKVDGCHSKPRATPVRVLLPHEVLDSLAQCSTDFVFSSIMLGQTPDQSRRDFWAHVATLEPWKDHPIIRSNDCDWNKLIGFHIHGDGCEFYREDEYFIWSWSSIFSSSGMIKDCLIYRFPIAVIPERQMLKAEVSRLLTVVLRVLLLRLWLLIVGVACLYSIPNKQNHGIVSIQSPRFGMLCTRPLQS